VHLVQGRGKNEMGTVISFTPMPRGCRAGRPVGSDSQSAEIIILPVVRIERHADTHVPGFDPEAAKGQGRRRRRRANRS
jgi:hypothetical protein